MLCCVVLFCCWLVVGICKHNLRAWFFLMISTCLESSYATFWGFSFNLLLLAIACATSVFFKGFFVYIQSGDHPSIGTCQKSGYHP